MPTVYLALMIPLLVTGIFYFIKKHEFTWWEFFIPLVIALVAVVVSKLIIDHTSVQFTEYWGSTIMGVYEEEPYNYWQSETCTREVPCGTDSNGNTQYCTETYDCSHQEDVGPSWWAISSIDESINLTEKQHDDLVKQFGTKKSVIKTRKNYDANDRAVSSKGTKFEGTRVGKTSRILLTSWNGSDATRKAYTSRHKYENRIKATDLSIFNISLVTEKEADSLGLFKYPDHKGSSLFGKTNGLDYPTILGDNISEETQEKFRKLNGKFGTTNQLRLWILVFDNKPMSIAQYQENYWVKGNKNELVICIGRKGNEIVWSHAFSWAHSDVLTTAVKNKVLDLYTYKDSIIHRNLPKALPVTKDLKNKILGDAGNEMPDVLPVPTQMNGDTIIQIKSSTPVLTEQTWNEYYNYLNNNLQQFKRREFAEFSYLSVEPSKGAIIFVYLLTLFISIGVNIWVIKNDIKD